MKDYIITQERIQEALPCFRGRFGGFMVRKAMRWFGVDRANAIYKRCFDPDAPTFCRNVLDDSGINMVVENSEVLEKFRDTPFVTISNHPYGHVETLGLMSVIGEKRPDYKFMGNAMLHEISILSPCMVGVRPSQKKYGVAESAFETMEETLDHIRGGHPMGFYPAGKVSHFRRVDGKLTVTDMKWRDGTVSVIRRAGVTVIPVYFSGHNSWWYNLLGAINIRLRDLRLIKELSTKKGRTIYMRFGEPIPAGKLDEFATKKELSDFLRGSVYGLEKKKVRPAPRPIEPLVSPYTDCFDLDIIPYADVITEEEQATA